MAQDFAALDAVHQMQPTNFDGLDANLAFKSDSTQMERVGDAKLFVRFYSKPTKDDEESVKQNRAVFKDVVYINIKLPGDKFNDVNRTAFPEDIQRFPMHYERFRKGQEQIVGTPIDALPFLTEAQAEEYKALFIKTVEQLAGLPDSVTQRILGSVTHKQQAQAWLDSFKGADRLRAEFEEKDKARDAEMAELRARLDAMTKPQNVPAGQVKK